MPSQRGRAKDGPTDRGYALGKEGRTGRGLMAVFGLIYGLSDGQELVVAFGLAATSGIGTLFFLAWIGAGDMKAYDQYAIRRSEREKFAAGGR
jgi:hypothetical protein